MRFFLTQYYHLVWPPQICGFTLHRRGGVGGVRSYHGAPPSRGGEISNHEQLAHYLTVWVFCFSSLCWEISGALWCWALLIGTLERSARWAHCRDPLTLWHSLELCALHSPLPHQAGTACSEGRPCCSCWGNMRNISVSSNTSSPRFAQCTLGDAGGSWRTLLI